MTARLTPETARVGMRVVCVDVGKSWHLREGGEYRVIALHNGHLVLDDMPPFARFLADRFIPAEPASPALPALTPELLEALREWHAFIAPFLGASAAERTDHPIDALATAIEGAPGILAPPEQPAPPLPAMWCGADAFEGEG
jgi:hypothetical protein